MARYYQHAVSCILIVLQYYLVNGKIYDRCELARELREVHDIPDEQLATWVCIAKHESQFDTTARNLASGDHGLFQISQLYWCSPPGEGYACGVPCSAFWDDDIEDDVICARRIFREHRRLSGDGFNAWVVYNQHCKDKYANEKYVDGCFDEENDLKHGETTPRSNRKNSAKRRKDFDDLPPPPNYQQRLKGILNLFSSFDSRKLPEKQNEVHFNNEKEDAKPQEYYKNKIKLFSDVGTTNEYYQPQINRNKVINNFDRNKPQWNQYENQGNAEISDVKSKEYYQNKINLFAGASTGFKSPSPYSESNYKGNNINVNANVVTYPNSFFPENQDAYKARIKNIISTFANIGASQTTTNNIQSNNFKEGNFNSNTYSSNTFASQPQIQEPSTNLVPPNPSKYKAKIDNILRTFASLNVEGRIDEQLPEQQKLKEPIFSINVASPYQDESSYKKKINTIANTFSASNNQGYSNIDRSKSLKIETPSSFNALDAFSNSFEKQVEHLRKSPNYGFSQTTPKPFYSTTSQYFGESIGKSTILPFFATFSVKNFEGSQTTPSFWTTLRPSTIFGSSTSKPVFNFEWSSPKLSSTTKKLSTSYETTTIKPTSFQWTTPKYFSSTLLKTTTSPSVKISTPQVKLTTLNPSLTKSNETTVTPVRFSWTTPKSTSTLVNTSSSTTSKLASSKFEWVTQKSVFSINAAKKPTSNIFEWTTKSTATKNDVNPQTTPKSFQWTTTRPVVKSTTKKPPTYKPDSQFFQWTTEKPLKNIETSTFRTSLQMFTKTTPKPLFGGATSSKDKPKLLFEWRNFGSSKNDEGLRSKLTILPTTTPKTIGSTARSVVYQTSTYRPIITTTKSTIVNNAYKSSSSFRSTTIRPSSTVKISSLSPVTIKKKVNTVATTTPSTRTSTPSIYRTSTSRTSTIAYNKQITTNTTPRPIISFSFGSSYNGSNLFKTSIKNGAKPSNAIEESTNKPPFLSSNLSSFYTTTVKPIYTTTVRNTYDPFNIFSRTTNKPAQILGTNYNSKVSSSLANNKSKPFSFLYFGSDVDKSAKLKSPTFETSSAKIQSSTEKTIQKSVTFGFSSQKNNQNYPITTQKPLNFYSKSSNAFSSGSSTPKIQSTTLKYESKPSTKVFNPFDAFNFKFVNKAAINRVSTTIKSASNINVEVPTTKRYDSTSFASTTSRTTTRSNKNKFDNFDPFGAFNIRRNVGVTPKSSVSSSNTPEGTTSLSTTRKPYIWQTTTLKPFSGIFNKANNGTITKTSTNGQTSSKPIVLSSVPSARTVEKQTFLISTTPKTSYSTNKPKGTTSTIKTKDDYKVYMRSNGFRIVFKTD